MFIDRNLSFGSPKKTTRAQLPIPEASLRRLPQYHHYLIDAESRGVLQISCSTIGRDLNFTPIQVRKDLQYTGIVGKPKMGYSVRELIQAIELFLGWNNANEAFLAGTGNLGTALLGHERFSRFGLHIVAAFDTDPTKIGQSIYGKTVLPMAKLSDLARRMVIHLGIITTPAGAAQNVANAMVEAGILAIWNFTPCKLRVPKYVFVRNEDLYSSLASLSWKLAQRLHTPMAKAPEEKAQPSDFLQDDPVLTP